MIKGEDHFSSLAPHAKLAAILVIVAAVFAMGYSMGFRAAGERTRELDARLDAVCHAVSKSLSGPSADAPAASASCDPDGACDADGD